jgi:uncharacterized membrane protein YhaH (DUF805 family)
MDVTTAYAVLRLKPESSLDETGKVFDAQATRLGPNRVNRSLRPAAESKMAQVKEAWDAVRGHLESGGGPVTYQVAHLPERSHPIAPIVTEPRPAGISLNPVAGWHVQADGVKRYWDGEQWTGRTARPAQAGMSFPKAVSSGLTKYVDFSGRARRSEYWWYWLFQAIVGFGSAALDVALDAHGLFQGLVAVVMLLPGVAMAVRRLHDNNRSGWSVFIALIPLVGSIMVLVFLCEDSGDGPNRYGPSPKYS